MMDFKIPKYTCPDIDDAIKQLKTLKDEVNDLEDKLEELRDANSALREAAEGYKEQRDELIIKLERAEELSAND